MNSKKAITPIKGVWPKYLHKILKPLIGSDVIQLEILTKYFLW